MFYLSVYFMSGNIRLVAGLIILFLFMIRRPPISTRTDTLFPYTTLFRSLFAALSHFQTAGGNITKTAPILFLDSAERAAVGSGDAFRPSLYKVLLFRRIAQAIKSGSINLSHSINFRPLDGSTLTISHWRRDRDEHLPPAGTGPLSTPP